MMASRYTCAETKIDVTENDSENRLQNSNSHLFRGTDQFVWRTFQRKKLPRYSAVAQYSLQGYIILFVLYLCLRIGRTDWKARHKSSEMPVEINIERPLGLFKVFILRFLKSFLTRKIQKIIKSDHYLCANSEELNSNCFNDVLNAINKIYVTYISCTVNTIHCTAW